VVELAVDPEVELVHAAEAAVCAEEMLHDPLQ
jgi:hypothetical protein